MTDASNVKSAFLSAAYGKLTPHLMKYTAKLDGDKLAAHIVVLDAINDDELDTIFEILGDTVGHLGGTANFEVVRTSSRQEADLAAELPIKLFRAYSLNEAR